MNKCVYLLFILSFMFRTYARWDIFHHEYRDGDALEISLTRLSSFLENPELEKALDYHNDQFSGLAECTISGPFNNIYNQLNQLGFRQVVYHKTFYVSCSYHDLELKFLNFLTLKEGEYIYSGTVYELMDDQSFEKHINSKNYIRKVKNIEHRKNVVCHSLPGEKWEVPYTFFNFRRYETYLLCESNTKQLIYKVTIGNKIHMYKFDLLQTHENQ